MKRNGVINLIIFLYCVFQWSHVSYSQYSEQIDTFYTQTPEYSTSLGLDSLHFPCAITTPSSGSNFPVVILVHGTSALDMDANATKDYKESPSSPTIKAQTRMFYEIADGLSSNGIMVLRYDKRSYTINCIEKPACWWADTISPYDYIKDVQSAVNFAKTLPQVDTCNIYVLGHSQGANFVADVGLARNDIRGVISMGPTAQPIDSVVVYQTEFINSDPLGAMIVGEQFDSLRNGLWPMNDTLYDQHFSPRFWLDWISITDSAITTQQVSSVPSLLMYGTIDQAVPPSTHLTIWQDSISRANMTFMLFDTLDHAFGPISDSTIAPPVIDSLVSWINYQNHQCSVYASSELLNNNAFEIYPNPTKNQLSIKGETVIKSVKIYSFQGELLIEEKYSPQVIDVASLRPGNYIIVFETENQQMTKKFIKN